MDQSCPGLAFWQAGWQAIAAESPSVPPTLSVSPINEKTGKHDDARKTRKGKDDDDDELKKGSKEQEESRSGRKGEDLEMKNADA